MTNRILFSPMFLFLCSCSHNLKFAANHFAVPVTAETQWGGHVAISASGVTNVTVVEDITTSPPTRNRILINERTDVGDSLYVNAVSFGGSLSLLNSLEAYLDNSIYGLRWQFLNHGSTPDQWVMAAQVGLGSKTQRTNLTNTSGGGTNSSNANSDIKSRQLGLSLGYKLATGSAPYISYVHESHDVTTDVQNNSGTYPNYEDHGVHQSLAMGFTTYKSGLHFTIEYALSQIDWDRADRTGQGSLGGNIGFAW